MNAHRRRQDVRWIVRLCVTHKALSLLLCVRLERAWVAASLNFKLSLLSSCTTAGIPPETRRNQAHSHFIVVSVLLLWLLCEYVCTQISEAVFAGKVEAHGGHSMAGSRFHTVVRHRQKLYQNLLNILLMEQFAILGYTHRQTSM